MRLIDADAIKIPKGFFEKVDNVPKFYDWLNDQPTVDPVKHGKWIDPQGITCYKCSVCGEYATQEYGLTEPIFWHYCPNCGAKMNLGRKDA